jgi:signal transduction histidine kinase
MTRALPVRSYKGGYLIGFIVLVVVVVRAIIFFEGQQRVAAIILLAAWGLLYAVEPLLSTHLRWFHWLYFPLQTSLVLVLANLHPFFDLTNILYIPLSVQVLHAFSRRVASAWMILFAALLCVTLILGLGWAAGLALSLTILAASGFLVSYDMLYARTQADQAESQALLAELQQAHQRLQGHAAQAEELAMARERNRLARELHDSVSQAIFSVTLTSQAARLLLKRDPARVSEQLDRLQEMTSSALSQLRSLIAQLRPPPNP